MVRQRAFRQWQVCRPAASFLRRESRYSEMPYLLREGIELVSIVACR